MNHDRRVPRRDALLRPSDSSLDAGLDMPATARLLGRLYDGIDCEGLPTAVVGELDREPFGGEAAADGLGQVDLVVDDQHSHAYECRPAAHRTRAGAGSATYPVNSEDALIRVSYTP